MNTVPAHPPAMDAGASASAPETLAPLPSVLNRSPSVPVFTAAALARAEIDTSAPFESVREAVDRFGGSAFWKPQPKSFSLPEVDKQILNPESTCLELIDDAAEVEQQTVLLEKDLIAKERKTLEVLKELEMTKKTVHHLKTRLEKEFSGITANAYNMKVHPLTEQGQTSNPESEENTAVPAVAKQDPELILVELRKAKLNLNRTTDSISGMQAYIEFLRGNIAKEKTLLEKTREKLSANKAEVSFLEENLNESALKLQEIRHTKSMCHVNPSAISNQTEEVSAMMKVVEEKSEVLRLTSEVEHSKTGVRNTEEPSGVTLPIEVYLMLKYKAQEAEEMCRKKIEAAMHEVDESNRCKQVLLSKVDEATAEVKTSRKALEEALLRVETATKAKLMVEEALRKWRFEHGQKRRSVHNSTKFKNAYPSQQRKDTSQMLGSDSPRDDALRPPMSIGQILSMKLMCPSFDAKAKAKTNDTGAPSLAQVLSKSHRASSPGGTEDGSNRRRNSTKRKKLGFMSLSVLLSKQDKSKKKMRRHAFGS